VAHRIIVEKFQDQLEVVAINAGSSTDLKGWMYLLKYDSVYGAFPHELSVKPASVIASEEKQSHEILKQDPGSSPGLKVQDDNKRDPHIAPQSGTPRNDNPLLGELVVDGKTIPVYSQKDPALLPWRDLGVDVVIESTGHFRTKEKMELHVNAGAKAVVLSAPEKGGDVSTVVLSVNDKSYQSENIISCASCTTNSIAPVAKVMEEAFGIEKAMLTTIHGYTSDQRLHDGGHKDYRRSRAAALNIVPTSTGATKAAAKTLPSLQDKFTGLAVRVPVPVGSLSDLTFLLKKDVTTEEVNSRLTEATKEDGYKGILAVTNDPIVSSDIIGSSYSSIVDLSLTHVVGGNMLKVIAWYDNEYGYASRLVEEVAMVGKALPA